MSRSVFALALAMSVALVGTAEAKNHAAARTKTKVRPAKSAKSAKNNYPRSKTARATVKLNRVLRSRLRKTAESTSKLSVFHQIKNVAHREKWASALKGAKTLVQRRKVISQWMGTGRYPGLWTLTESGGWYNQDIGGKPFEIKLRKGSVLYDADNPEHVKVYQEWKAGREALHKGKIPNAFDSILDASGTPLSKKAGGVKAPKDAKFYKDMKIAGVAHYDTYGRKCVILFNASAISGIKSN